MQLQSVLFIFFPMQSNAWQKTKDVDQLTNVSFFVCDPVSSSKLKVIQGLFPYE